jgi:Cu(I)/Ag(I) efflux system membrane protein CusA/SilA
MIGGMVSSTLLTLIVIPAVYGLVKGVGLAKTGRTKPTAQETVSAQALEGA